MAFNHGKNSTFKVDRSGGTLTDISTYLDNVDFPRTVETAETTTFQVTGSAKTYIVGLVDSTISISGKFDNTATSGPDAVLSGIYGQAATVSFEYGPEGGDTGDVKYSGEAILTEYSTGSPVGDVTTFSASFQVTGVVTKGTFA